MDRDKLLEKWLKDDITQEERKAFDLLEDSSFYKKIAEDASLFKASDFSAMPDFETFKMKMVKHNDNRKAYPWYSPILKIASVIVVAFGIYYFSIVNNMTTVQTLNSQKTSVSLPDESQVILNALSQIAYDKDDWSSNRRIELKGEAFFDVAKGETFDVVTSDGTISVLGTEFNVKQRKDYFEVTCYEGTVRVNTKEYSEILTVGDNFRIYKGAVVSDSHNRDVPEWMDDRSYFDRIPLAEVILELERQYNINVETENVDMYQLFTGGFIHSDLKGALEQISIPLELKYDIIKPKVVRLVRSD